MVLDVVCSFTGFKRSKIQDSRYKVKRRSCILHLLQWYLIGTTIRHGCNYKNYQVEMRVWLYFFISIKCLNAFQTVIDLKRSPNHGKRVEPRKSTQSDTYQSPRRQFIAGGIAIASIWSTFEQSALAAPTSRQRAVGAAELECRANGDCLQKFELDGAIGWQWGAKDRCDASDPLCGSDGKMLDAPATGAPVPAQVAGLDITHICSIDLTVGKDGVERGSLVLGLYGNAYPQDVERFIQFLEYGIVTSDDPGFGKVSTPVSLARGGQLSLVYPRQKIEFGIPSQSGAYAKLVGRSKASDNFSPQPRPLATSSVKSMRPHDCAGLVSVPVGGIGNSANTLTDDDEAFANAFQITATAVPSMDREGRKVIGQVLDSSSMAFLERLASLPPNKGLKGVLPGQSSGPPLLKVVVRDTSVMEAKWKEV